jgi:hypothetical protein
VVWAVFDEGEYGPTFTIREREPGETRGVPVSAEVVMRYRAVVAAFDELQDELEAIYTAAGDR